MECQVRAIHQDVVNPYDSPGAISYFSGEEMLKFESFWGEMTRNLTFLHWKNTVLPTVIPVDDDVQRPRLGCES